MRYSAPSLYLPGSGRRHTTATASGSQDCSQLPSSAVITGWRSACRPDCLIPHLVEQTHAFSCLSAAAILMTLVTVDAVVNIVSDSPMIRVGLVFQMTIGALKDRIVVGVGMAGRANSVGIAVIDGKLRVLPVIKSGVQPAGGVVASLARRGKELRLRGVSGIGCGVVIRLVATDAGRRERRVIVVDVAAHALRRGDGVHAGQREWRVVVVERRVRPQDGVVAQFALLRESGGGVIRVGGSVEVGQMTGHAGGAGQVVVIVYVAIRAQAWRNGMRPHQRKSGGGVIKFAVGPQHGVVAVGAVVGIPAAAWGNG